MIFDEPEETKRVRKEFDYNLYPEDMQVKQGGVDFMKE